MPLVQDPAPVPVVTAVIRVPSAPYMQVVHVPASGEQISHPVLQAWQAALPAVTSASVLAKYPEAHVVQTLNKITTRFNIFKLQRKDKILYRLNLFKIKLSLKNKFKHLYLFSNAGLGASITSSIETTALLACAVTGIQVIAVATCNII